MEKSVDDLLKAIKREYAEDEASPASASDVSAATPPANAKSLSSSASTPSVALGPVSDVPDTNPVSASTPSSTPETSIETLLTDLGISQSTPVASGSPPTPFSTVRTSTDVSSASSDAFPTSVQMASTDQVLDRVKSHYEAEQAAKELKRQQALEADRQLKQQLEAQQRQEREAAQERQCRLEEERRITATKQAETWLAELDLHSDEGLWFESFAINYPSKLDAALDYLSAMESVEP